MRQLLIASLICSIGCSSNSALSPDGGAPDAGGACVSTVTPKPGTVITDSGAVTGVALGTSSFVWRGIPYAAPPTGDLRWKPPAPPACWTDERPATAFAPDCPQFAGSGDGMVSSSGTVEGAEDCLYLNVWAPQTAPAAPLPVMVFIHGGANVEGSASSANYDGQYLSEHGGAIVVSVNYRLGPLGFLVHSALEAENDKHVSGNYGILDQQAALAWVQRNIARFGGDTKRVMVFGESAGAVDVCVLVASPLSVGLFSRALMESGACYENPMAAQEPLGTTFAQNAGCGSASDVAACLRALTPDAVLKALPPTGAAVISSVQAFAPNVDGWVLLKSPIAALADGSANHVPFVVGSNSDETALAESGIMPPITTEAEYETAVNAEYPTVANQVLNEYKAADYPSPAKAFVAVTTDARFICTARQTLRAAIAGAPDVAQYRYFFTHPVENGTAALRALGAWHGEELAFVFHTLGATASYTPTAAELALSDSMVGLWSAFAATGNPGGGWPQYASASDPYLGLDDVIAPGAGVRTTQCDFWDSLISP